MAYFCILVLCTWPPTCLTSQVQEAVRTTVLGIMGSLPRHAFETTAISTGGALANLMFQLQMTGYMFKNAEYRLSLQSSMHVTAYLEGKETMSTKQEMIIPMEGFHFFHCSFLLQPFTEASTTQSLLHQSALRWKQAPQKIEMFRSNTM